MNSNDLKKLLEDVKNGSVDVEHAYKEIKDLPYEDLGFAKVDHHRAIRNGYPEVIYCEGKTINQIVEIVERLMEKNNNILATRASREVFDAISEITCDAEYHRDARIVVVKRKKILVSEKEIAVITAGTSDIPVAEEAAITAEVLGNKVNRIYDVGVAGIHRLLSKMDVISRANVIIVVAGMEGALASVVGGLVDKPVVAVPTSVGYGANFGGLSALLTMLNSCASGIGVVNIDNGFGAGYLASNINKL
ncbi:nickel pincer cofactor biosynthesis protein LarB [Ruminiclostridium papyrosolvens]|uniref:1-(5-phosphoribosyl)-5-amino-4-imidazole-carboxylate carboxylase n=1 Tax=Ruminiclostridium papyrosolvens C7 TaxID=1330534 RepID=U4R2X4_9FIRM|nr:nickel pincer cofactor biosynthesis protein LarB [Ruminiclostridium papyrosolvens]EPR11954.1 1-(5-phosphoribosyl)-5-amino-4-imidazole-carboxylate carboxylase [Ruminiclostridium papyrosolvens C7]